MNSNNENIIFYRSWWDSLSTKSDDFRHSVLDAVLAYAFNEIEPTFPKESGQAVAFENMVDFIKKNREKFAKKQEVRRAAIEARWSKQKGVDDTKNTNVSFVCDSIQMNSPAHTIKDKDKDKDNVKDKDKDNVSRDKDTLSLSPKEKKENSPSGDAERERVVFDYALFLLSEGRVNAYTSAVEGWDYNESLGWQKEIVRKNGDRVLQPVRYKLPWLKNRDQKPPQEFDARHGELLANILRRSGMKPANCAIIDDFRGIGIRDGCAFFLYTRISPPVVAFRKAWETSEVGTFVAQELCRFDNTIQTFNVIEKSKF